MKTIKFTAIALIAIGMLSCNNNRPVSQKNLNNGIDSMSYALGLDMGLKLRVNFAEVNEDIYLQGLFNGIDSTDIQVNVADIGKIINDFMQKRREAEMNSIREQKMSKSTKERKPDIQREKRSVSSAVSAKK